jgi:dipeptidyl aminopeptidase/acylaminoacyl peptidase
MKALYDGWTKPARHWFEGIKRRALLTTVEEWIGGPPTTFGKRYTQLSPINYVRKDAAPLLLLHGMADTVIPVEQSVELARRLREKGAPVNLLLFENAPHDFDELKDMNAQLAASAAVTFLQEHLGKR